VKLLFNQNLSRRLVGMLSVEYPESRHVTEVGLDTATDAEIWSYAGEHDFVIVSKDSDFRQLAFLHGPPPKAIWVRLGNATTIEIFDALRDNREEIARFGSDADEALLVLP
jgi:predicted nuclease of predicted toxin-antitoxin system